MNIQIRMVRTSQTQLHRRSCYEDMLEPVSVDKLLWNVIPLPARGLARRVLAVRAGPAHLPNVVK